MGTWMLRAVVGAGAVGALTVAAGCGGEDGAAGWSALPTVSGTVTYRERVALSPTAELTVRLLDASRPDAVATFLADVTVAADGAQVPLAFGVPYDPAAIDAQRRYVLEATIVDGGVVRFRTTGAVPVLTGGAPVEGVEVLVRSAGG